MSHDLEPVYVLWKTILCSLLKLFDILNFLTKKRFLSPENERRVNFTQITKSKIRTAMSFSFLHFLAGKKRIEEGRSESIYHYLDVAPDFYVL